MNAKPVSLDLYIKGLLQIIYHRMDYINNAYVTD